jgi:hypothetical protein
MAKKKEAKPVDRVARSGLDCVSTLNVQAEGKLAKFHVLYRKRCGGMAVAYFASQAEKRRFEQHHPRG